MTYWNLPDMESGGVGIGLMWRDMVIQMGGMKTMPTLKHGDIEIM